MLSDLLLKSNNYQDQRNKVAVIYSLFIGTLNVIFIVFLILFFALPFNPLNSSIYLLICLVSFILIIVLLVKFYKAIKQTKMRYCDKCDGKLDYDDIESLDLIDSYTKETEHKIKTWETYRITFVCPHCSKTKSMEIKLKVYYRNFKSGVEKICDPEEYLLSFFNK